jgi:hypothetical protein
VVKVLMGLLNTAGQLVYFIAYVPVWLLWHGALKHVIRVFWNVSQEPKSTNWTTPDAKRFLATIYYNYCLKQATAEAL